MPTIISAKRDMNQRMVVMTDLDLRINDEVRMDPRDTVKDWQLGAEGQNTQSVTGCLVSYMPSRDTTRSQCMTKMSTRWHSS